MKLLNHSRIKTENKDLICCYLLTPFQSYLLIAYINSPSCSLFLYNMLHEWFLELTAKNITLDMITASFNNEVVSSKLYHV